MRRLAGSVESNSHVLIHIFAVARYILLGTKYIQLQFRSGLLNTVMKQYPSLALKPELDSQAKFKATVLR